MTIKIYGGTLSPFVRKTVVFAIEKGIDFELVAAFGAMAPPEFRKASPFGKIPAMVDGDFSLADSTAIVTYLDAIKPEPNLIPTEAKARAKTIWYEEFGDTLVAACGGKVFFNRFVAPRFMGREGDLKAADEAQANEFPKLVDYLERVLPASGYLVEDRFTLADIAVCSPFATMAHVDCTVNPTTHPKAYGYIQAITARPSFAKLLEQERAMVKPKEPA
ncbi:glutathione S-transferase family protein [Phenylobacterium sp. J367]|uniref:glutathione S-transferase family protein n=1 Tax=Phenylobacterium sp. J367 TaxID=2898435 RepID=UPI002150C403|nr:glutathione S-transferase family protein [Phenylobacterium sp. J367]MCR5879043.1 glutathione S-transferase family protein [Phenylobacterium sp. J367]